MRARACGGYRGGGGGGGGVWVVSRTQPVGMAGKAQAPIHALAPVQQPANPRRRRCSRARVVSAAHSLVAYTRRVHCTRRTPPARNAFLAARDFRQLGRPRYRSYATTRLRDRLRIRCDDIIQRFYALGDVIFSFFFENLIRIHRT